VTAGRNLSKEKKVYHNWRNIALVLLRKKRGQACNAFLSCSCKILWFKILALEADGPGLPLQHYGMEAGKAGGYISFHRLKILALRVMHTIYGFFGVYHGMPPFSW
jgi:hypothetical protein